MTRKEIKKALVTVKAERRAAMKRLRKLKKALETEEKLAVKLYKRVDKLFVKLPEGSPFEAKCDELLDDLDDTENLLADAAERVEDAICY